MPLLRERKRGMIEQIEGQKQLLESPKVNMVWRQAKRFIDEEGITLLGVRLQWYTFLLSIV